MALIPKCLRDHAYAACGAVANYLRESGIRYPDASEELRTELLRIYIVEGREHGAYSVDPLENIAGTLLEHSKGKRKLTPDRMDKIVNRSATGLVKLVGKQCSIQDPELKQGLKVAFAEALYKIFNRKRDLEAELAMG
ncbi:hypothetical protein KY325_00560 [Candidatus Woesearchaeota archaeon]|nr:hypothetical protein [Candidatus Woesearchaeota archaeon]